MQIDADREWGKIQTYLDTLEARDDGVAGEAARFLQENIIRDDSPITSLVGARYLSYVLARGLPSNSKRVDCPLCTDGWVSKPGNSVYPCEVCREEQHRKWWSEDVDEDWDPS